MPCQPSQPFAFPVFSHRTCIARSLDGGVLSCGGKPTATEMERAEALFVSGAIVSGKDKQHVRVRFVRARRWQVVAVVELMPHES